MNLCSEIKIFLKINLILWIQVKTEKNTFFCQNKFDNRIDDSPNTQKQSVSQFLQKMNLSRFFR